MTTLLFMCDSAVKAGFKASGPGVTALVAKTKINNWSAGRSFYTLILISIRLFLCLTLGKISRTLGFINKIGPKAMRMLCLDNDSTGIKTIYTEAVLNDMNGISCLLCVLCRYIDTFNQVSWLCKTKCRSLLSLNFTCQLRRVRLSGRKRLRLFADDCWHDRFF